MTQFRHVDTHPQSFLPVDLDISGFIDITAVSDSWRKYLDPKTNLIHDCAEYYAEYLRELNTPHFMPCGLACENKGNGGACGQCQ